MLSSFPMIATSCGVKKKDVETSNSENSRIQNPTQNLNAENQDSKKQTQNLTQNKEDSKPNSESKCRKSRFKKTQISTI
nr:hypothetical protein [Mycoplasmopsis bovis]